VRFRAKPGHRPSFPFAERLREQSPDTFSACGNIRLLTAPVVNRRPYFRRQANRAAQSITIPIDLPRDEASAFAELLKRTSFDDCLRRSNRRKTYSDGREEADVMWSALRLVENQFGEAGFAPR